ncbi:MAG: ATP-dependent RecD-like DNA helicase [Labilithrix sp.]|nr:ATP-dependent RecD-like DNA helicase [Labilithrix sp.]MCW5817727.1 ATP-dependent RecD-like DNA helicase [Labilithrix sp.]
MPHRVRRRLLEAGEHLRRRRRRPLGGRRQRARARQQHAHRDERRLRVGDEGQVRPQHQDEVALTASAKEVAIEGDVAVVTFENNETGFRVVKVDVSGRRDRLTIVGLFPRVGAGARIRARGVMEVDRQHGEQLRATSVTELAPTTLAGIERYLGSGMIRGIGQVTAQRIVQHFKLDTLRVLDEEPHRLREVSGLGRTRAEQLAQAWTEQRAIRDVMVFLQAHGASVHLAARIFKRYGAKAVAIVSSDPYRLAIDVWGIGFRTADKIASELGIAKDSPQRMQAALLQSLRDATENGHSFIVAEELVLRAARLVSDDGEPSMDTIAHVESALEAVRASGHVVAEEEGGLARVAARGTASIYETRMHDTEVRLAGRLAALARAEARALRGFDDAVERFEKETGTVLAEEQRLAVTQAARCPLLVITGGPGVGKTTIVKAILGVFERAGVVARLAAPTGRAAKRMSEATGKEAMTLHRLLEFDPKTSSFKRDAKRPVDGGALVVDESSMVDVWMADALTQAVPDGARLILVGDVDQLPSVGPGSVLRDAITSGVVPCVRLVKIFRQAEESLIVQNAHRINGGEMPIVPEKGEDADFFVMQKREPEEALKAVIDLVTKHIPRRFGLDPVRDVQVLTPMNRGGVGTMALNEALQSVLNPGGAGLQRGRTTFRVGDKVMQLRNDYDKNVYNGDVGIVSTVDTEEDSLTVRFDETREVPYDGRSLDELTLAYACTVHKSQGSEYPAVVIPLLTAHFVMLSKNLVYTGVTRGKRLVVLVADPRAVKIALGEQRREERRTKLALRIRAAAG